MIRIFIGFFLIVLVGGVVMQKVSSGESKTRVFFIGNSLTSINNLPGLIVQLAKSRQHVMEYEMAAPGGYRFSQHAVDPATARKIKEGKWDFVVLQEQSQLPAFSKEKVQSEVYPYAKNLCASIRKANLRTHIVFYITMARKNGDPQNLAFSNELATYGGMQQRINHSYLAMARNNSASIAPVGQAWAAVRTQQPSLELYADEAHPNQTGTYLAACVFYGVFFQDSPVGLPCPLSLNKQNALALQKAAEKSLKDTQVYLFTPKAKKHL